MIKKRGEITQTQLVLIIIALVALVFIVIFIISGTNILEWVRQLPDYIYEDAPDVSDIKVDEAVAKSICLGENPVGFVGEFNALSFGVGGHYINFYYELPDGKVGAVSTKLYWEGNEKKGEIKLKQSSMFTTFGKLIADWTKKDLLVASVKDGKVSVETNLLEYDSEVYQTTRFLKERPPELLFVPKLQNAHVTGANKLCRNGEEAKMVLAWPGEVKTKELDLKMYVDPETGEVVTQLEDYFDVAGQRTARFLFLRNERDFIYVGGLTIIPLKIYPDGSVWLYHEDGLTPKSGSGIITQENAILKKSIPGFLETNLRVDYYKIRELVESGKTAWFIEPRETDYMFDEHCVNPIAKILRGGDVTLLREHCPGQGTSNLKLTGSSENGKIMFGSSTFGEMKDGVLNLNQDLLGRTGSLYGSVKSITSDECILNLNKAKFISGYLCRTDIIIPGYSGSTVDKVINLDGASVNVKLTYNNGEGICAVVDGPQDKTWLKLYGLKDGKLEYYDGTGWKDVDGEILTPERIALKSIYNSLVEAEKSLRMDGLSVPIGFKSSSGLFINYRNIIYYSPPRTEGDKIYQTGFAGALQKYYLRLEDRGSNGEKYYILIEDENSFVHYQDEVIYGIDSYYDSIGMENNMFYSFNLTTKAWKKYEDSYLYVKGDSTQYLLGSLKEELVKVCK